MISACKGNEISKSVQNTENKENVVNTDNNLQLDASSAEDTENDFYAEGLNFLLELENDNISTWIKSELNNNSLELFNDYNGEKLQRISSTENDNYSPATCSDVIFYQAEQDETKEDIIKKMIEAIILPLLEPSDIRSFTITDYRIEEQQLISLKDNVWILPVLNGYYSYEGIDFVTMETYVEYESYLQKDGLMPFQRQGSDSAFVYILMENNGIYRLQRAEDMIME